MGDEAAIRRRSLQVPFPAPPPATPSPLLQGAGARGWPECCGPVTTTPRPAQLAPSVVWGASGRRVVGPGWSSPLPVQPSLTLYPGRIAPPGSTPVTSGERRRSPGGNLLSFLEVCAWRASLPLPFSNPCPSCVCYSVLFCPALDGYCPPGTDGLCHLTLHPQRGVEP